MSWKATMCIQRWVWCVGCPRTEQGSMFLQAGRDTPGCETDPTPTPECQPRSWMLQKFPLISFGQQRRKVLRAEVPFWLGR